MDVRLLIDSIVRQTTVLIAQLATRGGIRAPLAHVANQVFLDLVRELDDQGVSRKVGADMFGMALRAYQRKIQRLSESSTDRGKTLWQAVLDYLDGEKTASRAEVMTRFHRDEPGMVGGVLHDLTQSGLVFTTGSGNNVVYRAPTTEELGELNRRASGEGLEQFVWAVIYRSGPLTPSKLNHAITCPAADLQQALDALTADGRVRFEEHGGEQQYSASTLVIHRDSGGGWEGAVFDHYQALVRTIETKLDGDSKVPAEHVGGSTYTLDVWKGHPFEAQARGLLGEYRDRVGRLRNEIEAHNETVGIPADFDKVIAYAGQCVISDNDSDNDEDGEQG